MKNIIIKKLFLKKSLSQVQGSLFLSGQVFNFMQVGIFALFGLRTDTIVFCGFLFIVHTCLQDYRDIKYILPISLVVAISPQYPLAATFSYLSYA